MRPRFFGWVTVLLGLLLVVGLTVIAAAVYTGGPFESFERPAELVVQVTERDLDLADALASAPRWQRDLARLTGTDLTGAMERAAEAYREALGALEPGVVPEPGRSQLRARFAILLAELGRTEEFDAEVNAACTTNDELMLLGAVLFASRADQSAVAAWFGPGDGSLLPPGWAADRLAMRQAEQQQRRLDAEAARTRILKRGEPVRKRFLALAAVYLALLAVAIGCAIRFLRARFRMPPAFGRLRSRLPSSGLLTVFLR